MIEKSTFFSRQEKKRGQETASLCNEQQKKSFRILLLMYRFSHLSLCPLPQCGLDDSKKDHSVIVLSVFPKVGDFNGYVACGAEYCQDQYEGYGFGV